MSANSGNSVKMMYDTSKKKVTSAQRDLYIRPLLRLKQQEDILDKGLVGAIENMKIDSNLLQDIINEHKELSLKRRNFLSTMYKNIKDITSELDSAKHVTKNPEDLQTLDVNTYKSKLIKLSQKMQDFEKSCPIETLMEEGTALNTEVHEFEFNLDKYEKAQKNRTRLSLLCKSKIENRQHNTGCKDIDDFHALVAVTGHTENWTMEDHLFFLKTRKRCENIPALVAAIQKKCPDLSTEIIVNHEAWYKQYTDLREKQKAAVKEWRQKRESEKKKNTDEIEKEIGNRYEDEDFLNEIPREKATCILRKTKSSTTETRSTNSSASSTESKKKELIKKWKMEKENKRLMDEEQVKMQMILKRKIEQNRRKKRKEKIQEALEQYKKKKSLENILREKDEQFKEKCTYDVTLIKAFREQDKEFTKKRKNLILRSKKPNKCESVNIRRIELVEARSYSTLFDTTKVWREKCRVEDSTMRFNELQYIKDVPKMCIRWRNEESEDLKI
ncbi:coiled-coil domain-containing protein 112-like [Bombus vosnesenskii]|uniref:Coiled-coil domain-containing protein 112-like n=1 Tax=Bombus vosnesenskii TaxID=207650 RepID=A0A6J3K4R7_9HYME|nr:coiled-coil domain-containing protein 112-like [Bombus vosnesenskii]